MIIGFDWDGTLVESWSATPLPGVKERLAELPVGTQTFIASNQSGPVFRAVLGQAKYPTVEDVAQRIALGLAALGWQPNLLLVACSPGVALRAGVIDPTWQVAAAAVRDDLLKRIGERLDKMTGLTVRDAIDWRKPAPGMLLDAAAEFADSFVGIPDMVYIGDMDTDRQAATAAGCRYLDAAEWRERGLL
jgi:hypothetical protein